MLTRKIKLVLSAGALLGAALMSGSANAVPLCIGGDLMCLASGGSNVDALNLGTQPYNPVTTPDIGDVFPFPSYTYPGNPLVTALNPIVWYDKFDLVGLYLDATADLTYEFLGYEAGYLNRNVDISGADTTIFTNRTSSNLIGATYTDDDQVQGAVEFNIQVETDGSIPFVTDKTWINGAVDLAAQALAFNMKVGFWEEFNSPALSVFWVFLDDGGASETTPDSDWDDLVFRITAAAPGQNIDVPIPAALPLFLGGLGMVAYLGRRRARRSLPL